MPTVNEKLADEAIAHAAYLQSYSNGVVRRIVALLNRTDADIAARLTEALDQLPQSAFTVERLEVLLASVRSLNVQAYTAVELELTAELRKFAEYEAGHQLELFRSVIPPQVVASVGVAQVIPEQVYAAAMARPFQGRLLKEWAQSIEADRMLRIRDAVRQGYVQQETIPQIVQRVRGTRAKGYADGLLEIDRRAAEAVVRTAISHTAGFTRDRFYEANGDLIKAQVWTATLDTRTSEICRPRDGKQYQPVSPYKPIGHSLPWLGGPGRAHWNAVPAGTMIATQAGPMAIEAVRPGMSVWTHRGRLRPVADQRSKLCEGGVVRVAHTQSGRTLRATYDHPVLTSAGWKFMGALEVGDDLLRDQHSLDEVAGVGSAIGAEAEHNPAVSDDPKVALARALQLVPADVNLKGGLDVRAREIEDRCARLVLGDPERIKSDECAKHHLFATAQALQKLGRNRLGDLLASLDRDDSAAHPFGGGGKGAASEIGVSDALCNAGHAAWVALCHAFRMQRVGPRRVFRFSPSPVLITGGLDYRTRAQIKASLIGFASDLQPVALGVSPQGAIGKAVSTLNSAEGSAADQVLVGDEGGQGGIDFGHDPIVALEVQTYLGVVYDLSVEGDASYIADGLAVSNCRSTATPVVKSWKELGANLPDFSPSTRASMDGQVPAEQTYGEWLKRQSAARQDAILGPTRGKLLRDGGLTLDGFYNDKGHLLSLDELRSLDAAAFKRAGL